MKNFLSKLGLVSLTLVSFLSVPLPLAGATFSDVPANHPYAEAIAYVQGKGIVSGYADGTFKPNNFINRAELTKIIMEAVFPGQAAGSNCFPDVGTEWFAQYVCLAKTKGVVSGYSNGKFEPAQNINFVESAKIFINGFGYQVGSGTPWYKPYVEELARRGTIPLSITSFDQRITRGEFAEIVYRLKENITNKSSRNADLTVTGSPNTNQNVNLNQNVNPVPVDQNVTIQNFAFSPNNLEITKGTKVTWKNQDSSAHSVVSSLFSSGTLNNGETFSFTFDQVGTFDYHCGIHPSMTGLVTVK